MGNQLCRFSHCEQFTIIIEVTLVLKRELLITIQLLAIIAQVLRRRFRIATVGRLREEVTRTEDPMVTALTLMEQIEKRGQHGWIEPLVEDMGAWMLLQLGDVANLLEVVLKYVLFIVSRCCALGMNS